MSERGFVCPICGDEVPYRICGGRCIPCHDAAYLASGMKASEWITEAQERAAIEEFEFLRRLTLEDVR